MKAPKGVIFTTLPSYSAPTSAIGGLIIWSIQSMAFCADSRSAAPTRTTPSSSMSMSAPVSRTICWIILPFGPMMSPILSTGTSTTWRRGAVSRRSSRGPEIASSITSRTFARACFALRRPSPSTSEGSPCNFVSSCSAVTNSAVPATLKSMSPMASSAPRISVRVTYLSPSWISPIAMPATGDLIGTPASIKEREDAHTDAIEVDPFELIASETNRYT